MSCCRGARRRRLMLRMTVRVAADPAHLRRGETASKVGHPAMKVVCQAGVFAQPKLLFLLAYMQACNVLLTTSADGQEVVPTMFRSAIAPYVEYSNTSSHILIGSTQNRRIAAFGLDYKLRLRQGKSWMWYYVGDLRPIVFLQDPISSTTQTIQFGNQTPDGPFLIQNGPIPSACRSATYPDPRNGQSDVTVIDTRICGARWTYAGGLSPLGQEVVVLPKSRIKPYAMLNAGLILSTRDVPADRSSALNFTFEFGAGVRIMQSHVRGVSLDYRIRHLSNRNIGDSNPGIDNQVIRLSYLFGRR